MPELVGLPYSPWTEKARWALDARGVSYRYTYYAPLLGEPALRMRLKKWTGRVSVPVLTDDDGTTLGDSQDIARWADRRGAGPTLFPNEHDAEIRRLVEVSEQGMSSGRLLSMLRTLADDEALKELVPRNLRALPLAAAVGAMGVRRTLRKYGALDKASAEHEATLSAVLDQLRAALERAPAGDGPKTIFGSFSFADIAMTQVLTFVSPPGHGVRIGRANRKAFTDDAFCARYADLVTWRDALYTRYRPKDN